MSVIPRRTDIANLPLHYGREITIDQSIELLSKAINKTKLGLSEKEEAMNRLNRMRMR